jgi:hypothetical protein
VRLLQSRTDEAIRWLEKARIDDPDEPYPHAYLASAYGLAGEAERAAAELAEARELFGDGSFSSIRRLRAVGGFGAPGNWGVPQIQALFENTFFVGLRKAGVPEK